jgi:hypothetical protein
MISARSRCAIRSADSTPGPNMKRLLQLGGAAIAIIVVVWLYAMVTVPLDGPRYCRKAFRAQLSSLDSTSHVFRTVWTRTLHDHWVAAIVVQSENLRRPPTTIVCHFGETDYRFQRLEVYEGDHVEELKRASTSNLSPLSWFPFRQ